MLLEQHILQSKESGLGELVLRNRLVKHLQKYRLSKLRRKSSLRRMWRQRKSWRELSEALTDHQFLRYFCMSRKCFEVLCQTIKANVGEEKFKSEEYLRDLQDPLSPFGTCRHMRRMRSLTQGHLKQTGGIISGEVKLAITLRMLAGGSYLDLGLLFGTRTTMRDDDEVEDEDEDDRMRMRIRMRMRRMRTMRTTTTTTTTTAMTTTTTSTKMTTTTQDEDKAQGQ